MKSETPPDPNRGFSCEPPPPSTGPRSHSRRHMMRALTYGYAAYAMYARRTLLFHGGRSARKGGPPAPPCRTRPHRKLEAPYKRHHDEVLIYRNIYAARHG